MRTQLKNSTLQKYLIGLLAMLIIVVPFFIMVHTSFAQAPGSSPVTTITPATGKDISFLDKLGNTIGNAILFVASRVTWVGAMILQESITKLVLGMGEMIRGNGAAIGLGNTINTLWTTIRDICNLAFIFGFIFLGIRTIIDSESASTKKMLASIIIGALLINFSLFFVKVVIDVSNYLAVEINNAMVIPYRTAHRNWDIADQIGEIMRVQTLYSTPGPNATAGTTAGGSFAFFVMGALFLIVAGFVLAAGGILLIIRFVALVFIMVFSPVLFAATVFPGTKRFADLLWSKLLSYAFFAPAYLFLIFVSLKLLEGVTAGLRITPSMTLAGGLSAQGTGFFSVVLIFIICILALIFSLKIAQSMSIAGADKALSFAKTASGTASAGLLAASGRATFGRFAHNMSENESLKDKASKKGFSGWTARQQLKVSRKVGDASFDARNVGGAGKALGVGDGRKGGYTSVKKEVEEKEMKFAKSLGEVGDDDVRVEARKREAETAKKNFDRDKESLRKTLREETDPSKREMARKGLEELEKKHRDAEESYGKEKQRRVLGGTYNTDESTEFVKSAKAKLDERSKAVKEAWKEYDEMWKEGSDAGLIKVSHEKIQELKEQESEAKKQYKHERSKASKDGGYAAVLKESKWYNSWTAGRLIPHNKAAGESVEKAFEKKIKKSKEDSRTDSIVEAVKSSNKT